MNQKLIIGIVAIVLVGGGALVYASVSDSKERAAMEKAKSDDMAIVTETGTPEQIEAMKKDEAMMDKEEMSKGDTMVKDEMAMKSGVGSYVPYDASKITMASASNHVVLFFRASWCPTCIALDKDIKAHLTEIPGNLTILDVNYDNSAALKKKYGVTYQHTFVEVDAQGTLIKKWSGSLTLAALVSEVK